MINIHELLTLAIHHRASDLLLKSSCPPALRIDGAVVATNIPAISSQEMQELARSIIYSASRDYILNFHENPDEKIDIPEIAERHMQSLSEREELDLVFTIPNLIRVRANLFLQQSTIAAALRIIPLKPLGIDELNLPAVLRDLVNRNQGLVLVTGPTGSGKSTTLAAMIEQINSSRRGTIFTIEDPVEYVFEDAHCMVFQREIGRDTRSFSDALRSVLRQSPDVIMVGEMRDAETMVTAMQAAEMGHLVLSSVHATSATGTVDRILNAFPPHEKEPIRDSLADCLQGVISLRLLRRLNQPGRVPAVEVMINTPTIRKHIVEGSTLELYSAIREGRHFGMNTMNQALERLYQGKLVSYDDALAATPNPQELRQMLRREGAA